MSKPTPESINLGNVTYARGFNDGLNGRPVTIKKSHAHIHRYNKGYRLGEAEKNRTMSAALDVGKHMHDSLNVSTMAYTAAELYPETKPKGLLNRFITWLRG